MTISGTESDEPQTEDRPRPRRKAIPDGVKLKVVVRQVGRCKDCNGKLAELECVEFDHRPAIINREVNEAGTDYVPAQLDPEYIFARCGNCHDRRTFGPGGEKRITTAGGDIHTRDRTRDLQQKQAEFRQRLMSKDRGEEPPAPKKPKWKWPKRKMESRNSLKDRRS